jgi:hypothetical protein
MSTDAGAPLRGPYGGETHLPRLETMRIRRVPYVPPKLRHFESRIRHREAIEFLVTTAGPMPYRAYGPALFVGDQEIHEAEQLDARTIRFFAFDEAKLEREAPISWGWMKDPPPQRQRTNFRFRLDDFRGHPEREFSPTR